MPIVVTCAICGTRNELPDALEGQETECTFCFAKLKVPTGDHAPENLPGYEIKELLGAGSMGRVYRAVQLSMDRDVALKVIPALSMKRDEDQRRFMNEVRLLARMDHEGIVSAFEAGEADGYYFLAMTYVHGDTVDRRLQEVRRIPEREALHIALQVARALAYAWDKHHVLHRDIKPSNIMLAEDGQVRIMDLGISKVVGRGKSPSVTATGMVVGTPYYMSPEQAVSTQNMDRRSDIYSLGATLYEMVTGQKPFQGDNPLEVMGHHRFTTLPSPRSRNPEISRDCETLLYTMMAKDMKERYQNWEALIDDLERLEEGRPLKHASAENLPSDIQQDPGRTPTRRRMKPLDRRRGGAKMQLPAKQAATLARPPVVAEPSKGRPLMAAAMLLLLLAVLGTGAWMLTRQRGQENLIGSADAPLDLPDTPGAGGNQEQVEELADQRQTWQRDFEAATNWYSDNPARYNEASRRFRDLARVAPDNDLAQAAEAAARAAQQDKERDGEAIIGRLTERARELLQGGDAEAAVHHLTDYRGALDVETAPERQRAAATLVLQARQERLAVVEEELALRRLTEQLGKLVLTGRHEEALTRWHEANGAGPLAGSEPLALIGRQLTYLGKQAELIHDSFRGVIGEEVRVSFKDEPRLVLVREVHEDRVEALEVTRQGESVVRLRRSFTASELDAAEQIRRLGQSDDPGNLIARGVIIHHAGRSELALKGLQQASTPLAHAVAGAIASQMDGSAEHAIYALRPLLLPFGATPEVPAPVAVWQIWHSSPPPTVLSSIPGQLQQFQLVFGGSDILGPRVAVVDALERVALHRPALQVLDDHELSVTLAMELLRGGLPADARADVAVVNTATGPGLLAASPSLEHLDALLGTPFVSLDIGTSAVTDLAPLRGMPLNELKASRTLISDLSPLRGLPIQQLQIAYTEVEDLAPLRGLPLRSLDLSGTRIRDLEPLVHCPLVELDLTNCDILADISPLAKIKTLESLTLPRMTLDGLDAVQRLPKLTSIGLSGELRPPSRVRSSEPAAPEEPFAPLDDNAGADAPLPADDPNAAAAPANPVIQKLLRELQAKNSRQEHWQPTISQQGQNLHVDLSGHQEVTDLSALRGLSVSHLVLDDTGVSSLADLADMALQHLSLRNTAVDNLFALRAAPLTYVDISGTRVSAITSLRRSPLRVLRIADTQVEHLAVLDGKELEELDIAGTGVRDIDTLEGLPIARLDISRTGIRDFDVLAKLPLRELRLADTRFRELDLLMEKDLRLLHAQKTRISDLQPITNKRIEELKLHECDRLNDLTPLGTLQELRRLSIPKSVRSLEPLRQLPRLDYIHQGDDDEWRQTAVEFWEKQR